jgi:predicted dehydrogenase
MSAGPAAWTAQSARPVRVGLVGVGKRGSLHLRNLVTMDVAIPAVCDVNTDNLAAAAAVIEKAGAPRPEI